MTQVRVRTFLAMALCSATCVGGVQAIATAPAAHAFEEHHVDFNGDGYADLVISAAGKTVDGQPEAGEITVIYGSATGLNPNSAVVFTENTPGVPDVAHARDFWGGTHAVGDFNGDGYDDLAIGGQDSVAAEDHAGTVTILWGSSSGLTTTGAALYYGYNTARAAATAQSFFGEGLAAGDFNGDGISDLAIGAPGVSHDAPSTGAIFILNGSHSGLVNPHQVIEQGSNGVPGTREAFDQFGAPLFAADLDHDGHDDLLVGDPNEGAGSLANAGVVYRFWGSASGLTSSGAVVVVGANPTAHRDLGEWHAVVPGSEKVYAAAPGDTTNLLDPNHLAYVAQIQVDRSAGSSPAVVRRYNSTQPLGLLGLGMVAGTFGGAFHNALVMGDPGYNIGEGRIELVDDGGNVHTVALGGSPVNLPIQPGSEFGTQVVAEDFNHDGYDDLVVSAPFENVGSAADAGAFYLFMGSPTGPLWSQPHHVTQETPGIPGSSETDDQWGWA